MPRDVGLSDSKCWNGGHEWVKSVSRTADGARIYPHQSSGIVSPSSISVLLAALDSDNSLFFAYDLLSRETKSLDTFSRKVFRLFRLVRGFFAVGQFTVRKNVSFC